VNERSQKKQRRKVRQRYSCAWEARPDPTRKWPGLSGQSMLSGWAWAGIYGPIGVTGWVWVGKNEKLLKAWLDGPTIFWPDGSGQKNVARQSRRAGPGQQFSESGFLLARPDPTRPGPVTCPGIDKGSLPNFVVGYYCRYRKFKIIFLHHNFTNI
jgi:hypothetical protein